MTTKRELYNKFIDGLAICEDENGKPIGKKQAKKMYSFEEYVNGGAYQDDLQEIEYQKRMYKR